MLYAESAALGFSFQSFFPNVVAIYFSRKVMYMSNRTRVIETLLFGEIRIQCKEEKVLANHVFPIASVGIFT
jgi:hypothetical protein